MKKVNLTQTVWQSDPGLCDLCGHKVPERLGAEGRGGFRFYLCYECLHRMYYMLRRRRNVRVKREDAECLAEAEYRFGAGPIPPHGPTYE